MVLHELQKVDREWSSFLFMSGFRAETGLSPRAKETSSPVISHHAEERSNMFVKLKARKQVKKPMTVFKLLLSSHRRRKFRLRKQHKSSPLVKQSREG